VKCCEKTPLSNRNLQIRIFLIGQRHLGGVLHLLLVLLKNGLVDLDLRGSKGGSSDEFLTLN
jgi:hypothetical protein